MKNTKQNKDKKQPAGYVESADSCEPFATDKILKEMPAPFSLSYQLFLNENTHSFVKIHRLIDSTEVLVKLHTVIVLSAYFQQENVSDEMRGLLAAGLRTPSLGIWWQFAREIAKFINKTPGDMLAFIPGIEDYILNNLKKSLDGKNNLITFRNSYAHGATPQKEHCEADLKKYSPVLEELIKKAQHLISSKLITVDSTGNIFEARGAELIPFKTKTKLDKGKTYIMSDGQFVSLHPLLVYRENSNAYFFYNDLRANDVRILNYDQCRHEKDSLLKEDLLELYKIHEWGKNDEADKFKSRIEVLTESFKGRRKELHSIIDFTEENKGFLFFWGNPGIGKSSLMARAIQALQWSPEQRQESDLFLSAGGPQAKKDTPDEQNSNGLPDKIYIVEYFIRRDMQTTDTAAMFTYLNKRLEYLFKIGISLKGNLEEQVENFKIRLEKISHKLKDSERLMLVFDGLDEASDSPDLLSRLPRSVPGKIIVLYAARDIPKVRNEVYENLDREYRRERTLTGLSREDTRAFLYDYVNKYELKDQYVKRVVEKSEGNPLYTRLLCNGLENGDFELNDLKTIPTGISELYASVMKRFNPLENDFLRMLAVGKDYFSAAMLASAMGIQIDQAESIIKGAMELLIEDPMTSEILDYQLFHESLREYLRDKYPQEIKQWRKQLTEWSRCSWGNEDLDENVQRYAAVHLIEHLKDTFELVEAKKQPALLEEMVELIENSEFREKMCYLSGNSLILQDSIQTVQQLLIKTPDCILTTPKRIISYAKLYYQEPDRLYQVFHEKLLDYGKNQKWEKITQVASMGSTAENKLMLTMQALMQAPGLKNAIKSPKLEEDVNAWLKEADNPILDKFYDIVFQQKEAS